MEHKSKAYLVILLDEDLKVVGVDVKSESAWGLTRFYSDGRWLHTMANLYECEADSFHEASVACWDFYAKTCAKALVDAFPPEDINGGAGEVAAQDRALRVVPR